MLQSYIATPRPEPTVRHEVALDPPAWARAWADGGGATLVSVTIPRAHGTDGETFRQHTIDAYAQVRDAVDRSPHTHIVRMWNYLPGIHDPLEADCDRYMFFNAGRFAAVCKWFGGAERIAQDIPAASGIGHDGDDLVVHALAISERGKAVENPQQVSAFRYSRRYGPIPPCFARATRVNADPLPLLLIAGTAAITHIGDLDAQLNLTLQNLRILVREGGWRGTPPKDDPIDCMRQVRIYVARANDALAVAEACRHAFDDSASLEIIRADLCRANLLVEIEGVARLDA